MFFAAFIWIFSILNSHAKTVSINDEPICDSEVCKNLAEMYIKNMNQTYDPCKDFYNYACGNTNVLSTVNLINITSTKIMYRLKEILESAPKVDENAALTKAKVFYESCLDQATINNTGILSLLKLMDQYSVWPMTMSEIEWNSTKKSWSDNNIPFMKFIEQFPFINFYVTSDLKNSSRNIIWLSPLDPKYLSIRPSTPMAIEDILAVPSVQNYKNSIKNASKLIAQYRGSSPSEETLDSDAIDIIKFEHDFFSSAMHRSDTNITQNIDDIFIKMSIADLQRSYNSTVPKTINPKIDWLHLIKSFLTGIHDIDDSEEIIVTSMNLLLQLAYLLDRTPPRVIMNVRQWYLVKTYGQYSGSEMASINNRVGASKFSPYPIPRWLTCISEVHMGHVLSFAYVQKYFPTKTKNAVESMTQNIIESIKFQIGNSTWLDDYSKQGALRKLQAMKVFVGYPDWYKSHAEIDDFYKDLKVGPFYLDNIMAENKFHLTKKLKSLRKPVDEKKLLRTFRWAFFPIEPSASILDTDNSLTLTAGILQSPFFDEYQPDAHNYGGIGAIIGHEISHGFDDKGRQFDEDGNLRDWWTNESIIEYLKRAQCFINKYSNYSIKFGHAEYKVNAVKTLSENIADFAGIHSAYEAFQIQKMKSSESRKRLIGLEHLSSNQLFFLSFANLYCSHPDNNFLINQLVLDTHSPGAFRIIGVLSNMKAFAEAYQCPKESPMNPTAKCGIW